MSMVATGVSDRSNSPVENNNSGGYSSDSSSEFVDVSQMDPATLKIRIKAQVEYYFSQQNLNRDAFMISQMNSDGFIPVSIIASFKKVQKLTSDLNLIAEAVADSTICELSEDKTMLKTSWKRPARTTIILRDVKDDAQESDILGLFEGAEFKIVSARSDVGQTWFVTMENEDDAKSAVLYLLGKTLFDQPVKARLKSEVLRPLQSQGSGSNLLANPVNTPVYYPQYAPQFPHEYAPWQMMPDESDKYVRQDGVKHEKSRGMKSGRSGSTNRKQSTDKSPQGGRKKKSAPKKQAKTPVFKPQDFPSLSMGKLSLESTEENETSTPVEDQNPVETPVNDDDQQQASTFSWAAAAAKPPAPPAVVPATEAVSVPEKKPTKPSNSKKKTEKSSKGGNPVNSTPKGDRPKRGWETPGISEAKSVVKDIVDDVVENFAPGESNSEVESSPGKKSGAAWGEKKSFADVIKVAPEQGATVEQSQEKQSTLSKASKQEQSSLYKNSKRGDTASVEGNWRKNDKPSKPVSQ